MLYVVMWTGFDGVIYESEFPNARAAVNRAEDLRYRGFRDASVFSILSGKEVESWWTI